MHQRKQILRGVESLEQKHLLAADLLGGLPIDPVAGGYNSGDWFIADSFSFGVEREMKESGEKGGTADINIGVGELQECTISKSMDHASSTLSQFAIHGNFSLAASDQALAETTPVCYLRYKLMR